MTQTIIIVLVTFIAAIDIVLYWFGGKTKTFSHVLLELSHRYPIIPFVFGVVAGHVFWGNCL